MKKLPYGPKQTGFAPLSVGRKKQSLAWLTEMCPAELRSQTLFHETLIHKTESKPKYSIVLRSMAQLKAGWCLPAAYTLCTLPWMGGPDWPHPKCPHVQWVNPFQSVFFSTRGNSFLSIYYFAMSPDWKDAMSPLHRVNVRVFLFFLKWKNSNIQVPVEGWCFIRVSLTLKLALCCSFE